MCMKQEEFNLNTDFNGVSYNLKDENGNELTLKQWIELLYFAYHFVPSAFDRARQ